MHPSPPAPALGGCVALYPAMAMQFHVCVTALYPGTSAICGGPGTGDLGPGAGGLGLRAQASPGFLKSN